MTFGRRGASAAPALPAHRPVFGAAGRAPKDTVDGAAMAERRAAFLAAERARKAEQPERPAFEGAAPAPAVGARVREKSTGMAYLLWFFLGGLSVHRFYLGYTTSGAIQVMMAPLSYGLLLGGSPIGLVPLFAAGLWILGDAFVIPSMVREANERARRLAVGTVFA